MKISINSSLHDYYIRKIGGKNYYYNTTSGNLIKSLLDCISAINKERGFKKFMFAGCLKI